MKLTSTFLLALRVLFAVTFSTSYLTWHVEGFSPSVSTRRGGKNPGSLRLQMSDKLSDEWNGEVVSNTDDGKIRGCLITKIDGKVAEWEVQIDGVEADLGKFSDAIYRKITSDAKRERFQGFRPGTIPPHLMSSYVSFSMDECAREATLEALSQQNIRPFDDARMGMTFDTISFLPAPKKSKKKKKRKKNKGIESPQPPAIVDEPEWKTFDSLKEAITGGWKVSERVIVKRLNINLFCVCLNCFSSMLWMKMKIHYFLASRVNPSALLHVM